MKNKFPLILFLLCVLQSAISARTWTISKEHLMLSFDDVSASISVGDKRNDRLWRQLPQQYLRVRKVSQKAEQLKLYLESKFSFEVTISIEEDMGICFSINAPVNTDMTDFVFPAPFYTDSEDYYLLLTDGAGMLLPVGDKEYPLGEGITYFCGGGISMSWMGMVDKDIQSGYMAILQTPYDAALRPFRQQENDLISFSPVWLSSMEKFSYERKVKYHFFDRGGYVAQCHVYRDFIWKKNEVLSLSRKKERFPKLDKITAAPHIYVWDTARDEKLMREIKESGVDRALILWDANHTPYPKSDFDDSLARMGYGTGGYELFTDLHLRDTAFYEYDYAGPLRHRHCVYPGKFQQLAARKKEGSTYSNSFGHYVCPSLVKPEIEFKLDRRLGEYNHECIFLDVYQANGLYECYAEDHPLTREGYAKSIVDNYKYIEDKYNVFLGGEWGADFVNSHSVFVHGMMTLQRPWFESDINAKGTIYYYGNWKNNPRPSIMLGQRTADAIYHKYCINEFLRVPLYELVYHDAIITSWRWEDANHHYPEIWWKKDLFNMLYASAPLWSIDADRWEAFRQSFVNSYKTVCPWLQKVAYDRMLSHSFLSDDHSLQMTEFSSGNCVIVNFSDKDKEYKGMSVKARSYTTFKK